MLAHLYTSERRGLNLTVASLLVSDMMVSHDDDQHITPGGQAALVSLSRFCTLCLHVRTSVYVYVHPCPISNRACFKGNTNPLK